MYIQKTKKDKTQIDETIILKWAEELIEGINYLFSNKIFHNDIKTL